MKLDKFTVGQKFFKATVLAAGRVVENANVDEFSTREEAEADGRIVADSYDPEWQKRNPEQMEVCVREYQVHSVEADGSLGGHYTIDS